MMRLFSILIFLLFPLYVQANDAEQCIKIDNGLDRLSCYDKALGRTSQTQSQTQIGKWHVRENVSKLTDRTDIFLSLESDDEVTCRWKDKHKLTLYIRCMDNTTSLFFVSNCHMASGHGGYGNVTIRIDNEKARVISTDASTDNTSLGLWRGNKSIPLIKSLLGKQRLIAKMTPYNESPFITTFSLNGLNTAIEGIRKQCGW